MMYFCFRDGSKSSKFKRSKTEIKLRIENGDDMLSNQSLDQFETLETLEIKHLSRKNSVIPVKSLEKSDGASALKGK